MDDYIEWLKSQLGNEDFTLHKQRSRSEHDVFRVDLYNGKSLFFKSAPNLVDEKNRINWLNKKLPVPSVLAFRQEFARDLLLISQIDGVDLAILAESIEPEDVTEKLASAMLKFHSVNIHDWPFSDVKDGDVLLHGDVALPNIIYTKDGNLSGYIDLGDLKVGDKERDLIDSVWTLSHNLGDGYGELFLDLYGIKNVNAQMVKDYLDQY